MRVELEGEVVFEREVEVFDLVGHAQASLAYAWSERTTGNKRRFLAVLHVPPVDSAVAAVRATVSRSGASRGGGAYGASGLADGDCGFRQCEHADPPTVARQISTQPVTATIPSSGATTRTTVARRRPH